MLQGENNAQETVLHHNCMIIYNKLRPELRVQKQIIYKTKNSFSNKLNTFTAGRHYPAYVFHTSQEEYNKLFFMQHQI
jgi:hypothetical protein